MMPPRRRSTQVQRRLCKNIQAALSTTLQLLRKLTKGSALSSLALLQAKSAEHQHQPGRTLLDVVVRERAPILQLLAGKDEALLVRRNA